MIKPNNQDCKQVLFYVKSVRFLRYYTSMVLSLLQSGVNVHVVLDPTKSKDKVIPVLEEFSRNNPGFSYDLGKRREGFFSNFVIALRNTRNYRFLLARKQTEFRVGRFFHFTPRIVKYFALNFRLARTLIASPATEKLLALIESMVPADKAINAQIKKINPSIVVVAYRSFPCQSPDIDYIKSAKSMGIPAVITVSSWDSLTIKAQVQAVPDRLFVWNEYHKMAAIKYHHIPEDKVCIVGAYHFDYWFRIARQARLDRDSFCKRYGFNPSRPIIVYLASPALKNQNVGAVIKLQQALLKSSDEKVRTVQIAVRPYPQTESQYANFSLPGVVVVPTEVPKLSLDEDMSLCDMLYFSEAAVAVNTTALIDAIVFDKPTVVIRRKEYEGMQKSEHLDKLIESSAVEVAESDGELSKIISIILSGGDSRAGGRSAFISRFIRPRGIDLDAGDVLANEIVNMCKLNVK